MDSSILTVDSWILTVDSSIVIVDSWILIVSVILKTGLQRLVEHWARGTRVRRQRETSAMVRGTF